MPSGASSTSAQRRHSSRSARGERADTGSTCAAGSASGAAGSAGASVGRSPSTTWALVPDHPNALTPAYLPWARPGHATRAVGTRSRDPSMETCGFKVRKCRLAGMEPCRMARIALSKPAIPAAASR